MRKFLAKVLACTISISLFSGIGIKPQKVEAATRDNFIKVFGNPYSDFMEIQYSKITSDGYIIVAGTYEGQSLIDGERMIGNMGEEDTIVMKLNPDGYYNKNDNKCFITTMGSTGEDRVEGIWEVNGGYIAYLDPYREDSDFVGKAAGLYKFDTNGNFKYFIKDSNSGFTVVNGNKGFYVKYMNLYEVNTDTGTVVDRGQIFNMPVKPVNLQPRPTSNHIEYKESNNKLLVFFSMNYYNPNGGGTHVTNERPVFEYDISSHTSKRLSTSGVVNEISINDDYIFNAYMDSSSIIKVKALDFNFNTIFNKSEVPFSTSNWSFGNTCNGWEVVKAKAVSDGYIIATCAYTKGIKDNRAKRNNEVLDVGNYSLIIFKLNKYGNFVPTATDNSSWIQIIPSCSALDLNEMHIDNSGNILVSGEVRGGGSASSLDWFHRRTGTFLVKLDSTGGIVSDFLVDYMMDNKIIYSEGVLPNKRPIGYIPSIGNTKVFNGWYTSEVNNDPTKVLKNLPRVTSDIKLYANVSEAVTLSLYNDNGDELNIVNNNGVMTNELRVPKGFDCTELIPTVTSVPEGKIFNKWVDDIGEPYESNIFNYDTDLYASYKDASYTITTKYQNNAGTEVTGTQEITPGNSINEPVAPSPSADVTNITTGLSLSNVPSGKVFDGWYINGTSTKVTFPYTPTANCTIVAKYSNAHTVTFTDSASGNINKYYVRTGKTLGSSNIPQATPKTGYTFSSWKSGSTVVNGNTAISSDLSCTPAYNINSYNYSVQYVDENGDTIKDAKSITADYNSAIDEPDKPNIDGYYFKQWQNWTASTKVPANNNLIIKAVYAPIKYTVIFKDLNGNTIDTQTVNYGDSATAPEGKDSYVNVSGSNKYTWQGWNTGYENITNSDYTNPIVITPIANSNSNIRKLTVKFKGKTPDNSNIEATVSNITYGSSISIPSELDVTGYNVVCDTSKLSNITEDLEIPVSYEKKTYTVTFKYMKNGSATSKEQQVKYQEAAIAPTDADATGKDLVWDKDFSSITADTVVNAVYSDKKFKVTFSITKPDGSTDSKVVNNVIYGTTVTPPDMNITGYNTQYDKSLDNIISDTTINVTYTKKSYKVTFKYMKDGSTVSEDQQVKYQESAVPPTNVDVVGKDYTWDKDFNSITEDTVITAIYTTKKFDINIIGTKPDGTEVKETIEDVSYGTDITIPSKFEVEGYNISTSKPLTNITDSNDIEVTYSKKEYEVVFNYRKDGKDKTDVQRVKYMESATAPKDAEVEGYDLTWDKDFSSITDNTIVNADYNIKKFTVTFKFNKDGSDITEVVNDVEWGSTVSAPASSEWYGHNIRWDFDLAQPIKENKTINGSYSLNKYSLEFRDDDKVVYVVDNVTYDTTISDPGIILEKDGYRHDGWLLDDTDFIFDSTKVTADSILKPKWVKTRTVSFYDYDNIKLKDVTVDDGEYILESDIPTVSRDGYRFKYWIDESNTESNPLDVSSGDKIYKAVMIKQVNITYVDINNQPITVKTVDSGSSIPSDVIAPSREDVGYDFVKWDRAGEIVYDDSIVKPVYKIKTYTVHLEATKPDGSVISKDITTNWGSKAEIPSEFLEPGYSITWSPSIDNIKGDTSVTGTYVPGKHIVNFLDKDGAIIKTVKDVDYNSSVETEAPEAPEVKGYTFTNWDKDLTRVLGDTDYKALYEVNKYKVQFEDLDGNKLGAEQEIEFDKPATPPNDEDVPEVEGKIFVGWSTDIDHIYSDNKDEVLVIKPVYKYNNKRVVYLDMNGNLVQERYVQIDENVSEPIAPVVDGHSFIGWKASANNCDTLQIFTATYAKLSYTVTFMNVDNTVLSEQEIEYGNSAVEPDVLPTKEGHTFIGWSDDFSYITKPLILEPVFSGEEFTVKFLGANGEVISEQKVEYGESAIAPQEPVKDGYTFNGWLQTFNNVKSDLIIYPSFTENYEAYTVTFVDYNDKTLSSQKIRKGNNANPPTDIPDYNGKKFERWNLDYTNVNKDMIIKAVYEGQYLVKFLNTDESLLSVAIVDEGKDAVAPSVVPIKDGYVFSNWDLDYTHVNKDMTIRPVFKLAETDVSGSDDENNKTEFTVTFVDYDGDEIDVQTVAKGESAKAPSDPKRSGYTFKGWNKDFDNVQSDLTVKAKYKSKDNDDEEEYTVKFYGKDGELLKTETVEEGEDATAPTAPKIQGYEFKRWSKNFESVESDLSVNAIYGESTGGNVNSSTNSNTDNDTSSKDETVYTTPPTGSTSTSNTVNQSPTKTTSSKSNTGYIQSGEVVRSNISSSAYKQAQPVKVSAVNTSAVKASNTKANSSPIDYSDVYAKQEALKKTYPTGYKNVSLAAKPGSDDEDVDSIDVANEELYESPVLEEKNVYESNDKDMWKYMLLYSGAGLLGVLGLAGLLFARRPKKVAFLDDDGNTIFETKVKKGSGVLPPDPPEKEGYEFVDWDTDFTEINGDTVVRPIYKETN